MQLLLNKGGRITAINRLKQTLLHCCTLHFEDSRKVEALQVVQYLIAHHLDCNAQDAQGGSPLMYVHP